MKSSAAASMVAVRRREVVAASTGQDHQRGTDRAAVAAAVEAATGAGRPGRLCRRCP